MTRNDDGKQCNTIPKLVCKREWGNAETDESARRRKVKETVKIRE
jgi:hypothetical protein